MAGKDATRRAIITIGLDDRALARDLDAATRRVRKAGGEMDRTGRRVGSGAAGAGKGKGKGFGFGAAAGIGMKAFDSVTGLVTGVVGELYDFEKALVRTQIASGKSSAEMARTRASILAISRATGIAAGEILNGAQAYIDLTGDVAGAESAMTSFARIAQASGASVSDVATATAALKESMKLDSRDIEAAFSGLIQQGKAGAVSLRDLAGELSAVAPRFAKFGGSGLLGIADLGAALQIVRKGFGSASEAATGLEALMGALSLNADKFAAANVRIFKTGRDGKKEFRGFVDIIDSIARSRLAKDPTALTKAWGSKEAAQAFDMLVANRKELEKIYAAGQDAGAVQRDLSTYLGSAAGRMEASMNRMKVAIAEAMTPERIEKFARAAESVASAIEKIASIDFFGAIDTKALLDKAREEQGQSFATKLTHDRTGGPLSRNEAMEQIQAAARGEVPGTSWAGRREWKDVDPSVRRRAAEVAAKQMGLSPTGEEFLPAGRDPWNQVPKATGPARSPAEVKAFVDELSRGLQRAVTEGLAAAKIELKTDSNTTARTVANAPINRQPARGR